MTGNELLNVSLDLCGLRKTDGSVASDIEDLKQRAITLINTVISENSEIDCRLKRTEHKVKTINSLEDVIDCTDIIANSVLPYGLARLFMIGEDDALADGFSKLYETARTRALRFGKARITAIEEVY